MIRGLAKSLLCVAIALMGWNGVARAENIVVIGDSLTCGPFGDSLFQSLNKNGNHVTVYCEGFSYPENWIRSTLANSGVPCRTRSSENPNLHNCGDNGNIPPLAEILAKHRGEKFIVALGTNQLRSDPNYGRLAQVIKLSGSSCTWIGPPHYRPDQVYLAPTSGFTVKGVTWCDNQLPSFYQTLSSSVGDYCEVVDSRAATAPGTPGNETADGIHKGPNASNYWVDQILPQLTSTPVQAAQSVSAPCQEPASPPLESEGERLFRMWTAIGKRSR